MSFYSLQTNTINNRNVSGPLCNVVNNPQVCRWVTDNIPEATEVRDFPEQTPIDLTDIINARLERLDKARSSNSIFFNEPDYLSSAFLERGLRCSAAVCLLERGFWIEDIIELIKNRSVKDVPEILKRLSEKINLFSDKFPGGSQDVWGNYKQVAEALEEERIKEPLGKFRDRLKEVSGEEKQRQGTVVIPVATGFLVGKNYLLTNYHVFNEKDKDNIKKFIVKFRYEQNALGQNALTVEYYLDPESFCVSDKQLDYTLIRVKAREDYNDIGLAFPEAGENFGWLPMLMDSTLIAPPITREQVKNIQKINSERIPYAGLSGEPVFIIQHPQGAQRRIVLFNNQVQNISQNFLQYQADADFGSSGSPILNSQWQLVGLHHAALVKWNEQKSDEQKLEVQGNLGTRVCEMVKHLETRRSELGVAAFLDNERYVVRQGKQPLKGRIYILVGYERGNAPSAEHSQQEITIAKTLLKNIFSFSTPGFEVRDVLQKCDGKYEAGIEYINQQDYQSGDVAIEIRINFDTDALKEKNILSLYYADNMFNYKTYAEIVLQSILSNSPLQFSSGLQSDTATALDLQFCREVKIPCLVMILDFPGNNSNQVVDQLTPSKTEQRTNPAKGIWNGLESWVKVLSPIGFWAAG
ncbi:trypsin-like serine peptidase [Microcoleus vaginatus]|uniref:trypsin-like serine peptidase n=1 Tax=Microcoleus vaginatus TaxID=119532 RepID=UPI001F6079A2|nr:serine protease [Microcoleus vaginatus HSN003]